MINKKVYNYLAVTNTFIEWVEYSLFLYLGPVISKLFFPVYSTESGLLMTYGLFATAYLARPIASLYFGYLSDRIGRKPPMIIAMVLMGLATLFIGMLPTYQEIGFISPILLLICRVLQSVAVSGEFQSSTIFLMEHETKNKAFAGSLIIASASGGMFIGGLIASTLSETPYIDVYWRIPFLCTGIIGMILSILRTKIQETPIFIALEQQGKLDKNPISTLLEYKKEMLHIIIVSAFVCVFVYTCNGYYSNYLISHAFFTKSSAYLHCSITELIVAILAPAIAYTYGENNNKNILLCGIFGLVINAPLQFYAAKAHIYPLIVMTLTVYSLCDAMITSSIAFYLYKTLPANLKCTGVGFGWNIAAALFGGTAPLLSAHLVSNGFMLAPGFLVLTYGVIAILAITKFRMPVYIS